VRDEHRIYAIDVSIVNPAKSSACHSHVLPESDATSVAAEAAKTKSFAAVVSDDIVRGFVPFVVEATGRLGPAASMFVAKFSKGDTLKRTYFLNCLAACLARYNSGAYADARARLRFAKGASWKPATTEITEFYPNEN